MRHEHVQYLACPTCFGELEVAQIEKAEKDSIESGILRCFSCESKYNIIHHIPRFVPIENYSSSFGFQWCKNSRTQYDSYSGINISEKRFFEETKWPRDMKGQTILEVGCGSGRFTEQVASTGAMVVSMDYSCAVDANFKSNGKKENILIVQGDLYSMPFKVNYFDKLFCIGVIQHTPDVEKAFFSLLKYLIPGGSLVVDVYRYTWCRYLLNTIYWVRPFTKRLPSETLYSLLEKYINIMWLVVRFIRRLPKGRCINKALLIRDYGGVYPLSDELLKKWALLDSFDCLSPTYDYSQTLETLKSWFVKAKLGNIEVLYGHNGIVGRGIKPIH